MYRLPQQVRLVLVIGALSSALLCCNRNRNTVSREVPVLLLKSSSFAAGGAIPSQFSSCEGQVNDSPELSWQGPPSGTLSFALIVTDPDAPIGTFVHWVLYDLPPEMRELPQAVRKAEQLPNGSRQGTNDFGEIGYDGPCPPGHSSHRYVFDLYALDSKLNIPAGATKKLVSDAMTNHILAHGQLTGRYQR